MLQVLCFLKFQQFAGLSLLGHDNSILLSLLTEEIDPQDELIVFKESSQESYCSLVCHSGIIGQSVGEWVFFLFPPGGKERLGAIDFELVLEVSENVDPVVVWESNGVRDQVIQVNKGSL